MINWAPIKYAVIKQYLFGFVFWNITKHLKDHLDHQVKETIPRHTDGENKHRNIVFLLL